MSFIAAQPSLALAPTDNPSPGLDLLEGADAIASYLFGNQRYRRRVYYLVEKRLLPTFRLGKVIYARKSALIAMMTDLTAEIGGVS